MTGQSAKPQMSGQPLSRLYDRCTLFLFTSRLQIFSTVLILSAFLYVISWPRPTRPAPAYLLGQPFTVEQPSTNCHISEIPLRSEAYLMTTGELNNVQTISRCDQFSKFTEFINPTTLKLDMKFNTKECVIHEIMRPYVLSKDSYELKSIKEFGSNHEVTVDSEHVIVSCTSSTGQVYYDYHTRVLPDKGFLPEKISYWEAIPEHQVPMNVMILVLDSTSATDAFRQLPRTMKYLLEDLDFTYFSKYHSLGEPTLPNVIPLLIGTPAGTLFQSKTWPEPWDRTGFIWRDFNQSQFATAYLEDLPILGTFNYGGQTGFVYQPTDFYTRPIFTAWEDLSKDSPDQCLGPRPFWKYVLDYELEILRKLNGLVPSFTIPWLCWPFHDVPDTLNVIEADLLKFFEDVVATDGELLENTVMIVMGDHAYWKGSYAQTEEGLLERRLPLFLLRVPKRLKNFIPEVDLTVDENSKEVTSHYDVFQTLRVLSRLGRTGHRHKEAEFKGRNLFEKLPMNRTCEDAGIPEQFCACGLPLPGDRNGLELDRVKYVDRTRTRS